MKLKDEIKNVINKLPYIRWLISELIKYKKDVYQPPGHYYSPVVSLEFLKRYENSIFKNSTDKLAGLSLNEDNQLLLLNNFLTLYQEIPFKPEKSDNLRYNFKNDWFSYFDGISLYLMIRFFKPQRIIEIGSGFSSALMLDVNELFFDNKIEMTLIEPFPERLDLLTFPGDRFNHIGKFFQEVDIGLFNCLSANDFLFIDSSHVVKTGSEVNKLLFEVLPSLKPGVIIHFHDIFYPFEYPKEWIFKDNRSWNESYFLRAFLMYNDDFDILLFNSFLEIFYEDWFRNNMPLILKHKGSSLWLSKK